MSEKTEHHDAVSAELPACVVEYIEGIVERLGRSRRVRSEVRRELEAHFEDALAECDDPGEREEREEREEVARSLIQEFGEAKLLAKLIRRAKRRCRPLWMRVLIRLVQAGVCGFILFLIAVVWLFSGKPKIATDYVAMMNARVIPKGARPEDNAWPYYQRAFESLDAPPNTDSVCGWGWDVDLSAFTRLSDDEAKQMNDWLKRHDFAWEQCVAGIQKPWCWRRYTPVNGDHRLMAMVRAHELDMNRLALVYLPWRFGLHYRAGKMEPALDDSLVLAELGRHLSRPGGWSEVEQGYGMYFTALASMQIRALLGAETFSTPTLESLQARLEGLFPDGFPDVDGFSIEWEALDMVQHTYSTEGLWGGHFIPDKYKTLPGWIPGFTGYEESGTFTRYIEFPTLYTLIGFLQARPSDVRDRIRTLYARNKALFRMSPYERDISSLYNRTALERDFHREVRFHMLASYATGEAIGIRADAAFMDRAEYEATLTVIGLERFRRERGRYPEGLAELVPRYLRAIPKDPCGPGAMGYRLTSAGPLLYSWGFDFEDQGGVQTPGSYVRGVGYPSWGQTPKGGDRVFWPIPAATSK